MTNRLQQLSRRDIERLSAYLDGELSEKEAAALEARLQSEPLLRAGLEELRQTSQLLTQLPQVRVPRNFILSPEMAGQVERGWRYPMMQLATALAAFAFLVVVGFDAISTQGLPFGTGANQLAAEAPVAEQAVPEAMMEAGDQAEMDQGAAEPRAELEKATETDQSESFGAAEAPAEEEAEAEVQATPAPTGEAAALDEAEAERTAAPTATALPSPEPAETTTTAEPDQPPAPSQAAQNWLRWLEIGLATLVIVFAALTFRLRPR